MSASIVAVGRMHARWLCFLLLATTMSCSGGDGGGFFVCEEGTETCACYGNATCNAELDCVEGVCVREDCEAGAVNCPCLPGDVCAGDLVCAGGLCGAGSPDPMLDVGLDTSDSGSIEPPPNPLGTRCRWPSGLSRDYQVSELHDVGFFLPSASFWSGGRFFVGGMAEYDCLLGTLRAIGNPDDESSGMLGGESYALPREDGVWTMTGRDWFHVSAHGSLVSSGECPDLFPFDERAFGFSPAARLCWYRLSLRADGGGTLGEYFVTVDPETGREVTRHEFFDEEGSWLAGSSVHGHTLWDGFVQCESGRAVTALGELTVPSSVCAADITERGNGLLIYNAPWDGDILLRGSFSDRGGVHRYVRLRGDEIVWVSTPVECLARSAWTTVGLRHITHSCEDRQAASTDGYIIDAETGAVTTVTITAGDNASFPQGTRPYISTPNDTGEVIVTGASALSDSGESVGAIRLFERQNDGSYSERNQQHADTVVTGLDGGTEDWFLACEACEGAFPGIPDDPQIAFQCPTACIYSCELNNPANDNPMAQEELERGIEYSCAVLEGFDPAYAAACPYCL